MNNINIIKTQNCFSCRSCYLSCPKKAIVMKENSEGFIYPHILDECINCGICLKKCPSHNFHLFRNNYNKQAYISWVIDSKKRSQSTSGGIFSSIAEHFLNNNGVVFGASYDSNLFVSQQVITDISDLDKLKKSKYVESFTDNSYEVVKHYLERNYHVLYSGTPCQIAGLNYYLGKDYENLLTIDIICHGVPSQKLFQKYLKWLEYRIGGKIIRYDFRNKLIGGWECGAKTLAKTDKTTKIFEGFYDPYYASFLHCETYKESCYKCPFANKSLLRPGDITLGDFFEIKKLYPDIEIKKGVNLCIINNRKGFEYFSKIEHEIFKIQIDINDCIKLKPINLIEPSKRPIKRDTIYSDIDLLSEQQFFKRFPESSKFFPLKQNIKRFVYKLISKIIRRYKKG